MDSANEIILLISLGSGLMLVLALAFVLFFTFSQSKMRKEQLKAQETKIEYQEKLLHSTILTQEKERERIAKDLHDEVGSKLNVIHLYLHQLGKKAPEAKSSIAEMIEVLNDTIHTSRRISHDLLPPTLENFGLEVAIDELVDKLNQTQELSVQLEAQGERPGAEYKLEELNLFRILQELLNNTLKYAKAKHIYISLWQSKEKLTLEYRDDGLGFDTKAIDNQKGLGMKNIESRLQMINGSYELKSAPGQGMQIHMEVKLHVSTAEKTIG